MAAPDLLADLDAPISEAEVSDCLDDMATEKAPGPDGFTRLFYRTC